MNIETSFYPEQTETHVVSYQDTNSRAYYMPYNEVTNTIGYVDSDERRAREHILLGNAILAVIDQIPAELEIDSNNDGYVDM